VDVLCVNAGRNKTQSVEPRTQTQIASAPPLFGSGRGERHAPSAARSSLKASTRAAAASLNERWAITPTKYCGVLACWLFEASTKTKEEEDERRDRAPEPKSTNQYIDGRGRSSAGRDRDFGNRLLPVEIIFLDSGGGGGCLWGARMCCVCAARLAAGCLSKEKKRKKTGGASKSQQKEK
jgi:hypothetical protein